MSTPEPTTPTTQIENVPRGTIFALIVIPAGIIVWSLLWQLGFIASIVAFGVAFGAMWLYRKGSGGRISRTGAVRVTVITIATLILAIIAGLIVDFARLAHLNLFAALGDKRLVPTLISQITHGSNTVSLLLALVFGVLGCYSVLRTAFVQTRNYDAASSAAAGYGQPYGQPAQPYTIQTPPVTPGAVAPGTPAIPEAPSSETDDPKRN